VRMPASKFCRERRARRQSETRNAQQVTVHSAGHIITRFALVPQDRYTGASVGSNFDDTPCAEV
jgi:hypothetical protein